MNGTYVPVCADCGASDPGWASLNHGVLICSDCCFVHRNLGRHISQIRSLTKGIWHDKQLALIHYLYRNGSNNIWEHALHDSGRNKRKPVSNDPIVPKKESFIVEKYANLTYSIRPAKDEFTMDDLNKQLWSSVRTGHVETALRLLALGASPNFMDQENTSLHIAAKNGQALQVELLCIYGADVGQKNIAGQTPAGIAKEEGHDELAERLMELAFAVTDHFSMFLCGRKPVHRENQHFLIPDLIGSSRSDCVRDFRKQLQQSSGVILERLIQDVYDEVDRRELNVHWSKMEKAHSGAHQHIAIFLPPNSKLSATRNQLRQKLAKFSSSDFAHLIIDLLKEVRRRHFGLPLQMDERPTSKTKEMLAFNDTDLDEVDSMGRIRLSTNGGTKSRNNVAGGTDEERSVALTSLDQYLELKDKWQDANERLEQLTISNGKILKALQQVQKSVEQLQFDQADLRHKSEQQQQQPRHVASPPPVSQAFPQSQQRQATPPLQNSPLAVNPPPPPQVGAIMMSASTLIRPTHQQKMTPGHSYSTDTYPSTKTNARQLTAATASPAPIQSTQSSTSMAILGLGQQYQQKMPAKLVAHQQERHSNSSTTGGGHSSLEKKHSLSANAPSNAVAYRKNSNHSLSVHRDICGSAPPSSSLEHSVMAARKELAAIEKGRNGGGGDIQMKTLFNDEVFPDNLILETELLTNSIKALLSDLQNSPKTNSSRESNAMYHADSINHHIIRILGVIPDSFLRGGPVQKCAIGMESAMKQLSSRCLSRPLQIDETCQAAYDVAKAAKELLVTVHGQTEQQQR